MGAEVPRIAGRNGAAKNSYERRVPELGRTRWSGVKVRIRLLFALLALGCAPAHSVYIPRDPELRREPLYFYPGLERRGTPRPASFSSATTWDSGSRTRSWPSVLPRTVT